MRHFLFRWVESDLYAVTEASDGKGLPFGPGDGVWNPIGPFDITTLGALGLDPDAAREDIAKRGFYQWQSSGGQHVPITPDEV